MSPFGAGVAAYPAASLEPPLSATPGVSPEIAPAAACGASPGPEGVAHLAPRFGIYVHVPFCPSRCPYCDFTITTATSFTEPYLAALVAEARARARAEGPFPPAGSLFLGGGTPSMVDPAALARAVEAITCAVPLALDAEVSMESNPETVTAPGLAALRAAGVNRLTIGAQSFREHVLGALGRSHDAEATRRAAAAARRAGIAALALDLIYGTPGETLEDWRASLWEALALEPDHVSCYALTVEPGTRLAHAVRRGVSPGPDEDDQAAKFEVACEMLASGGYRHYEISNWAREGFACRHNLVYWTQGDYLGLGVGAHSHRGGVRSWNRRSIPAYIARPAAAQAGEERLGLRERGEEWVALRLRLVEGVDLAEAARRLGWDPRPAARALETAGLACLTADRLILTRRGVLLENEAAARLLTRPRAGSARERASAG